MTYNIESFKEKYELCKSKNRYQDVDREIYEVYFKASLDDLSKSQQEIISSSLFWSIAALDSSVTQFLHGLSIKNFGLRPKSRVCAENIIFSQEALLESDYEIIKEVRNTRNKAAYDAVFRNSLDKNSILDLINSFEKIFNRFGGLK